MPKVMVVDDTAVDRQLAGGLLEGAPGIEVCYAENGKDALKQIEAAVPDLVVTDLQMPELDGLELVNALREKSPDVPVVLMTAHGSEVVAAQALANGASSFVPKAELGDSLMETVMHILVIAESENRYKQLGRCSTKTDLEFELENEPEIIDPLIDMVQQVAMNFGLLTQNSRVQMGVALEHALSNAMIRGNLELSREEMPVNDAAKIAERNSQAPYSERRVYFRALVTLESAKFTVRSQGPGFDTSSIPESTDPESFKDGTGRGLVLIQALMDEVAFDSTGNELTMTKYRTGDPVKPR